MPELVMPGTAERCARDSVCIHTRKIMDSCLDKECLDCIRVYPTASSQQVLDRATSVKAGCAQLICAYIDVESVNFNRGYYAVDVRYFYRITADAFVGTGRPVEICGLAVYDKRAILYGGEGGAKVFTSDRPCQCGMTDNGPLAVVEAVDPLILGLKLVDVCDCRPMECTGAEIPEGVAACFGETLVAGGDNHRLFVTLGQFSIIRLERDAQLQIPMIDYCVPEKDCSCGGPGCRPKPEDPCELFEKVQFPMGQFFPHGGSEGKEKGCGC